MAFKVWQTGVHIQQDRVRIVSLVRERSGWCLRRWWAIPLAEGIIRDGKICQPEQMVDALRDWRKTLPHYHRVFLSFPAARTLQRSLPLPAAVLRDSEQLTWLGAALARELEMNAAFAAGDHFSRCQRAGESSSCGGTSEMHRLAGRSTVALGYASPVGTPLNYRSRKRG